MRSVGYAFAAIAVGLVLTACSGSSDSDTGEHPANLDVDLQPVHALSEVAEREARNMETHADAMSSAAGSRPDIAHWRSDADTVRAEARSLRLVANWAKAIQYDPGARADNEADLQRVLGDGRNLRELGELVVAHASTMRAHLEVMRQQAAGDAAVLNALGQLGADLDGMKRSGESAIERGRALEEYASRLAQSAGITLK